MHLRLLFQKNLLMKIFKKIRKYMRKQKKYLEIRLWDMLHVRGMKVFGKM